MQIYRLFSIYDRKVGSYMMPFFGINAQTVMRDLPAQLPADHIIRKVPGDFSLYEIGSFSDDTGFMTVHVKPLFICEFIDLLKTDDVV